MQKDLIALMHDPKIAYVSGGHLSTVLKTQDYVRVIREFLTETFARIVQRTTKRRRENLLRLRYFKPTFQESTFGAGARGRMSTFLSTSLLKKRKKAGEKSLSLLLALWLILPG